MTALLRSQLGPELEIVVLEMSLEEQMQRIRARHEGSEDAVQMMKVPIYNYANLHGKI